MKNNRVLGILCAVLGGLIGALPWVLMYVYGGMILAILSILIAFGALKGYQLAKGPVDKSLPWLIGGITILMVVFATLVIIPCLLLQKEGLSISITNLEVLYNHDEFMKALMGDLVISIMFAILGISGVFANLKRQVAGGEDVSIDINTSVVNKDDVDTIKKAFEKYNAFDKYNAVSKDEILVDSNMEYVFNNLRGQQIIKKYKGKYYFSEKAQNSFLYRFISIYAKVLLIIIIVIVVLALVL